MFTKAVVRNFTFFCHFCHFLLAVLEAEMLFSLVELLLNKWRNVFDLTWLALKQHNFESCYLRLSKVVCYLLLEKKEHRSGNGFMCSGVNNDRDRFLYRRHFFFINKT